MLPILAFCFVGFLGFLLLLAFAAIVGFRGLARSANGERSVAHAVAGVGMALAIVFLAGLGALGCSAATTAMTAHHLLVNGPLHTIELERGPFPAAYAALHGLDRDHQLHLRVKVEGARDFERLRRWLEHETHGAVSFKVSSQREGGQEYSLLDFALPVDQHELSRLEREIQHDFPWLELPESLRLELNELR